MENIRQAVERARQNAAAGQQMRPSSDLRQRGVGSDYESNSQEAELSNTYLLSNRIISQIVTDPRSRSFDMLRTQVLQSMDLKDWRILAVTSPTSGCGKTVTALNLALSIARQPERSVLVVDLDFQQPRIATSLGLGCDAGALGVLEGRTTLSGAIIHARVGSQRLMILPTSSAIGSAELMASSAMVKMFQDLKRDYHSQIIILDLPPILSSDDVIAVLPQIDCVLLVVAVGTSTVAEIEECNRHLQTAEVVRVVLNKVPEASTNYYY
jgi:protein-tyrosine kinase